MYKQHTLFSQPLGQGGSEVRHTFYTFKGYVAFSVSSPHSTGVSWDYLQSKLIAFKPLSQGLLLGRLKLRK